MNIHISIIIPVYNCEKYIERCVRYLMEQTIREGIEFIFINDCTPDNSMDILRKLVASYSDRKQQVKLIENEDNLGVFETRKRGLFIAKGEYVGWCDSDDWCEPDMFEKMYGATKGGEKDIVVCNYIEHGTIINKQKFKPCHTPHEVLADLWKGEVYSGSLCHHLYRREILMKSIEQVIPTNYGEDNYTNMYMLYFSSSIAYVDEFLYHVDKTNDKSIMHMFKTTKVEWSKQRANIDNVSRLVYSSLGGRLFFHVAINAWKYGIKKQFKDVFPNIFIYYYTYRECHLDINTFLFTPSKQRLKTFMVYNSFFLFWLYFRKTWR